MANRLPTSSDVLSTPPASPATAIAHFAARLSFETDVSDVHADLEAGAPGLVVVDSRSVEAWQQGHLPRAVQLPTREIAARAAEVIPPHATVVTYCWGPGCNGATRAALEFAKLGYPVKEMIGGYEYWVREGFPVRTVEGGTAPLSGFCCVTAWVRSSWLQHSAPTPSCPTSPSRSRSAPMAARSAPGTA